MLCAQVYCVNIDNQNNNNAVRKEEFFTRLDKAEQQLARGEGVAFTNREDMNAWLNFL